MRLPKPRKVVEATGDVVPSDAALAAVVREAREAGGVLVCTAQILVDALARALLEWRAVDVLVLDEVHNARGKHPLAVLVSEHALAANTKTNDERVPRLLALTATPFRKLSARADEAQVGLALREFSQMFVNVISMFYFSS